MLTYCDNLIYGRQCQLWEARRWGRKTSFCAVNCVQIFFSAATFVQENIFLRNILMCWEDANPNSEIFSHNRNNRPKRRSCKIFASCVNVRSTRFKLNECDFTLKLLKFYTLSSILTKITEITGFNGFALFHCE